MKYDRDWLNSIRKTEEVIRLTSPDEVPIEHRSLIKQQWQAQVLEFRSDLANGLDTSDHQRRILDLATLVIELTADARKLAR